MAIRKNLKQTRQTIEKIRESIDTGLAIKTLSSFANDSGIPPSVRVKACQVLLDKTMPSLTAADITHNAPEQTLQEKFLALVNQVGEKQARAIYPDLADKYIGKQVTHDVPSISQ